MSLVSLVEGALVRGGELLLKMAVFSVVFAVGVAVSIAARRSLTRFLSARLPGPLAAHVGKAVYYALLVVFLIVALGAVGVNLTGLAIAGGFAGIVVGIALQPVLSNLFAGLYLMMEKTVGVGRIVEIGGNFGEVMEVTPMFTRVRTVEGHVVSIANTQVVSATVKDFSSAVARRVEFRVGIAYREDAERAYEAIRRVLDEHPYVLVNPPPDVFVSELGSSGVTITVRVWTHPQLAYEVTKDLLWRIKKAISEAGIEIPFTQVDVWFRTPLTLERAPALAEAPAEVGAPRPGRGGPESPLSA